MTARWEPDAEVLIRGVISRSIAWYPPRHRASHGEEMLGVLLAAAPEGQRGPASPRRPTCSGAGCASGCTRARAPATRQEQGPWSDALAAFSVAAPLALLVWFTARLLTEDDRRPGGRLERVGFWAA